MTIGFSIMRRPAGWRLELGGRIDLSRWDIEYTAGKISCTPRPIELLMMATGALLFLFLALFIAASALDVRWLRGLSKASTGGLDIENGPIAPPTPARLGGDAAPARSKFEQDAASPEEMRQLTDRMMDRLTKGLPAEEKAKLMADIEDRSRQRVARLTSRYEKVVGWSIVVARIVAILPVTLFSLLGGICLYRALLHFRDRVELSVRQHGLLLARPKLFGGTDEREFALEELAAVVCYAVRESGDRRGAGAYSQWNVNLAPKEAYQRTIEFDVEHLHFQADLTSLTQRVQTFAAAISKMSGLPVLVRRSK